MKLLGIHPVEGGVALALPSGRHVLVALPTARDRAAAVLGEQILELLDDPDEPHAQRSVMPTPAPVPNDAPEAQGDALATLEAGIEVGRLVWQTFRVLRGRQ